MRISVIGPTYPYRGGIAQHTTLLVRHLRRAGHDVQFLSFSRQYPRWLYGRDDKDPSQFPLKEPAEYVLDSMNPWTWYKTARAIVNYQPDLVIIPWWVTFWMIHNLIITWIIKRNRPNSKLCFLCHNVYPHERRWFDSWAVLLALSFGDYFIAHAKTEEKKITNIFPDKPVLVYPIPGYEIQALHEPEKMLDLPGDGLSILFCGIVRPYKGLDVLLDAMPAVLEQIEVNLLVMGEFWEDKTRYTEQIDKLGLRESVTLINQYVEDELLFPTIKKVDLVVLPYRSATQSAMVQTVLGLGTPVIVTRVGGLSKSVEHGVTGLVVQPGNIQELSEAIIHYFQHGLKEKFQQSIKLGNRHYSWDKFIHEITKIIEYN